MSSKTVADRRPWSLALRLTVWYAGSSFSLVVLTTGYLYFALVGQLVEEDDEWLTGKAAETWRVAESRTGDSPDLRRLVETGGGRPSASISG